MNKQTEALKMAIEALESAYGVLECEGMIPIGYESAIQACKEALEQEQSFAEKTAQMSFMSLWDAYTTLKMKLEALEQPASKNIRESFNEMLEDKVSYYKNKQSAQKPVAKGFIRSLVSIDKNGIETWKEEPFYTSAPSWQGLSDDEIGKIMQETHEGFSPDHDSWRFARAIEQALCKRNCNDTK